MSKKNKEKKYKAEETKEKTNGVKYYISAAIFFTISYFVLNAYLAKFPFDLANFLEMINPFQYITANVTGNLFFITYEIIKILFFTFSSIGFGKIILKFVGIVESENIFFILSYFLGLCVIALFSLITGYVSLINKYLYLSFAAIGFSLWLYFFYLSGYKMGLDIKNQIKENKLYFVLLLPVLIVNLIQSLAPEIFYDTLVYHLGIPNYWLINDKIADLGYNIYSKLSLNHSVLYLFSLTAFGEQNTLLLNYITSVFCFLGIVFFFEKYFSKRTTFMAGLIFYSIFHVAQSSQSAASDIIAAAFVIAAYYSANKAMEEKKWIWICLSGLFSGFSFGTKYNTAFIIIAILLLFIYQKLKEEKSNISEIFKSLLLFSLGFSVFSMPWLVKNYINYSNPLFPFAYKIFNKDISSIDASKIEGLLNEIRQFSKFDFATWLKLPFLISTGQIINSEFFTPLFLTILPLAFFVKSGKKEVRNLWIVFIFSYISWSFSSTTIRHLFSAYFLISILAAYYINEAFEGWFKSVLKTFLFITVIFSINWIIYLMKTEERYRVVLGEIKKEDYLSVSHPRYPNPSYSLIKYINENLDENSKVLFVAEPKSFYIKKKFEASSVFDRNPLVDITMKSQNEKEIYDELKKMGFTHILINIAEAIRISRGYNLFYWSEKDLKKYHSFFSKHLQTEKEHERIIENKLAEKSVLYKITETKTKPEPDYLFEVLSPGNLQ